MRPLHKDFGVVLDYTISNTTDARWPGKYIKILGLKLYPRKTGELIIPGLVHNKSISKTQLIEVSPGKLAPPILTITPEKITEKQQFLIKATYVTSEITARLEPEVDSRINTAIAI